MLIVKNPLTGTLLVMCDDCQAMWPTPRDALANTNRIAYNAISTVVDPSYREVKESHWDEFMKVSPGWFEDLE